MPSWSEIISEAESFQEADQQIGFLNSKRMEFLKKIAAHTNRNVIAYYSGWMKGIVNEHVSINDNDKNAFMQAVYKLDKSKGLDLILHTPGGDIAATESIIDYLHSIFNGDIRAIVPQIAMSAGSMIALSCKSIMMGKQSNLGPIDPQMGGIACGAAIEEFRKAKEEVKQDFSCLGLWQVIISKYTPTFLVACEKALDWSVTLAEKWIDESDPIKKQAIIKAFTDHEDSKAHNRHISKDKCKELGLMIEDMEHDHELQDYILSLHHCYMIFFDKTIVIKAVENNIDARYFKIFNPSQIVKEP